jgi:hypothetical protein
MTYDQLMAIADGVSEALKPLVARIAELEKKVADLEKRGQR